MAPFTLFKYEGLGNDFLVLADPTRELPYGALLARALCDRHRGVGADGLLRISAPRGGGGLFMELRNADGSIAETSGNGMRCAVLAAKDVGLINGDEVLVETIVGTSQAHILDTVSKFGTDVRVEMGQATIGARPEFDLATRHAYSVNIGNPHLVLLGEVGDDLDVAVIGPEFEVAIAGGQNVELATLTDLPGIIAVDTWERGAGFTLACGSGSCASAAAMRLVGYIGDQVTVHNRGGDVLVELTGPAASPEVTLTGGTRKVAKIVIEEANLDVLLAVMKAQE
jgi:diaminopimelate epimerase